MRVSILICAAGGTETAMLSSTKKHRGVLVPTLGFQMLHVEGLIGGADDGAMCERTKHWARPTSKDSTPIFYLGASWRVLS